MDIVDGDQVIRYYFPEVELIDRDEIKGKNGEVYGYGVTLKAYPAQINKTGNAAVSYTHLTLPTICSV